jgi:hypothetical protein
MTVTTEPATGAWAPGAVWAVGRFAGAVGLTLWPSTRAERASAAAAAQRRLTAIGVAAGDRIALLSLMSDGVQLVPYEDALLTLGAILTPADSTVTDAGRLVTIVRQGGVSAVLGITNDTLDGLAQLDEGPKLLADVPLLVCDWAAAARLSAAGLTPLRSVIVGPLLAVECPARNGAHVDGESWQVTSEDGQVILTPRLPCHATGLGKEPSPVRTGLLATVHQGQCTCGSADPRIVPTD